MENLFDFIAVNPFLILICLIIAAGVYIKFYMSNPHEVKASRQKSNAKKEYAKIKHVRDRIVFKI
ncbi:MAG: hypothetical protein CFH44_00465 [Proteobacteria bacterium]|nr:MAG: hypothetical protein CFH44_00465 [Pseudomonadota bacterium]